MFRLKALTMRQPWAECIRTKGRNVENRSWSTKYRGWIAVHTSTAKIRNEFELCRLLHGSDFKEADLAAGVIIGFVKITDVIQKETVTEKTKTWFQGEYGFVIEDFLPLPIPIKVKGAMGLWVLEGDALKQCLDQLISSEFAKISESLTEAHTAQVTEKLVLSVG